MSERFFFGCFVLCCIVNNMLDKKADTPLLEVKDLTVERGGQPVIEELSFQVGKGEFLAILGPNGSGKSTLLQTILGFLPHSGEIKWSDHPNVSYLPERLSPQKFREIPLSIKEFFRFKGASDSDILETFESVGLSASKILRRNPGELSSGQFQRMLIAWSVIDNPDILLFDEPTAGIDVGGEETIYSLLHKFWEERGLTVVLVTHEINVVYAYATNVLCLNRKNLCYGPPHEVLTT